MIGNVSISIHELLAVARESEGVKAVKGDAILCEKRFAPDTRYMVEFLLLEQKAIASTILLLSAAITNLSAIKTTKIGTIISKNGSRKNFIHCRLL